MNIDGFEIERKFLVAMPERAFLEACERSEITHHSVLRFAGFFSAKAFADANEILAVKMTKSFSTV